MGSGSKRDRYTHDVMCLLHTFHCQFGNNNHKRSIRVVDGVNEPRKIALIVQLAAVTLTMSFNRDDNDHKTIIKKLYKWTQQNFG